MFVKRFRRRVVFFGPAMLILIGCAAPEPQRSVDPIPTAAPAPLSAAEPATPLIAADPREFLRVSLSRCEQLSQYTTIFIRQERRGLIPFRSLHPPERIQCWFRREPHSIRMKWLDPEIKFGESTFVAGQQDNRVRFVPRFGIFGLPPGLIRVRPMTPITWGEARYSVEEFGVEKLIRQTLDTLNRFPSATISFEGADEAPLSGQVGLKLRIEYPLEGNPAPTQVLYFDPASDLPIATIMLFPDGSIDTAYAYEDLNASVRLTDSDFLLDAEKADSTPAQEP